MDGFNDSLQASNDPFMSGIHHSHSLSVCLSFFLFVFISFFVCCTIYFMLFLSLSVSLRVFLSLSLCLCVCVCLSLSLSRSKTSLEQLLVLFVPLLYIDRVSNFYLQLKYFQLLAYKYGHFCPVKKTSSPHFNNCSSSISYAFYNINVYLFSFQ